MFIAFLEKKPKVTESSINDFLDIWDDFKVFPGGNKSNCTYYVRKFKIIKSPGVRNGTFLQHYKGHFLLMSYIPYEYYRDNVDLISIERR